MNNRAAADNRKKYDQYFTPRWAVEALLEYVTIPPGVLIGEPCAGAGHIVDALQENGYCTLSGEIDPEVEPIKSALGIHAPRDFLKDPRSYSGCDWIVTNPPYSTASGSAAEIFRQAIKIAPNVAMLMRLGWLEACFDRLDLLPQLSRVLVLPRVQFKGAGSSNSSPSVWCIWKEDGPGAELIWADRALCDELKREYGS